MWYDTFFNLVFYSFCLCLSFMLSVYLTNKHTYKKAQNVNY